jgi:hypothetical protein
MIVQLASGEGLEFDTRHVSLSVLYCIQAVSYPVSTDRAFLGVKMAGILSWPFRSIDSFITTSHMLSWRGVKTQGFFLHGWTDVHARRLFFFFFAHSCKEGSRGGIQQQTNRQGLLRNV